MLHVNYRFVVDFCRRNVPAGKILDYGCGAGEIVRAGLEAGLDITGCEAFYEGGEGTREKAADLHRVTPWGRPSISVASQASSRGLVISVESRQPLGRCRRLSSGALIGEGFHT